MPKPNCTYKNTYEQITEDVIAMLEKGEIPWQKPWVTGFPTSLATGKEYQGWNSFFLNFIAMQKGYRSPYWLTYLHAEKLGGHVRRGEKGARVVAWKLPKRKEGDPEDKEYKPFLGTHTVFNVEQCEGISFPEPPRLDFEPIEHAENILQNIPDCPPIFNDSNQAYYAPARDEVHMPPVYDMVSAEAYYAVLFHELAHSTGHPKRLGRRKDNEFRAFGSEAYSKEELIAEMASAMICGVIGIAPKTIENTGAYIQNWIGVLKGDKRLIFEAASAAQKAANYILNEVEEKEEA